MGLCNSPDIFQEKMNELMEGLEFVRAYLDDLLTDTRPVLVIGDYSSRGVFAQIIAKSHSSSGTGFLFCL